MAGWCVTLGVLCSSMDGWVVCYSRCVVFQHGWRVTLGVLCSSMDGWVVCYSRCVVFQHGWLGGVLL